MQYIENAPQGYAIKVAEPQRYVMSYNTNIIVVVENIIHQIRNEKAKCIL